MLQPATPPPMMTAWASSRMLHRIRDAPCSTPCEIEEVRPSLRRGASAGRRNVPDVDHSSPHADIVEEARRVTTAAQQEQIALKLTGGLGIYFHAPSARAAPFRREYRDLDFVGLSAQRVAVQPFLLRLGYTPDMPFNTLQGRRRLRYWTECTIVKSISSSTRSGCATPLICGIAFTSRKAFSPRPTSC